MRLIPVVLAGGRGERFWPLSRRSRPKQLLSLLSSRAMLADTIARLEGLCDPAETWILTAADLRDGVLAAAPGVAKSRVIGEPAGKNTAPAVALAAWWLRGAGEDVAAVVLPSDHRIETAEQFRRDIAAAARAALERRSIVILGIPPTRAETGYGYVEVGEAVEPGSAFHVVRGFREKPDAKTAMRYRDDGRHYWNAGIFVFPPALMLAEIEAHAPDIARLLPALPDHGEGTSEALARYYEAAPSISIDYAVMERSRRALVARAGFTWDDLGSWAALGDAGPADERGNVVRGRALLHDAQGVVAYSDGGLVAALGVSNVVVVRTGDVTLVCARERAQEVRELVERLKREAGGDAFL